jgi:hypothetical protein
MSRFPELRRHVSLASDVIADDYPTRRKLMPLVKDLEKLSPGEQEQFERAAQHLRLALDELLQLLSERQPSGF